MLGGWRLPDCLDSVGLPPAPLDTEDAVGAIKDAGRRTGLVGDLGLGLTKPVSCSRDGLTGTGFLPPVELGGFDKGILAVAVVPASLLAVGFSWALVFGPGSRRLVVPDEIFEAGPDFGGPLAAIFAEAANCRELELFLASIPLTSLLLSIFVLPPVVGAKGADLESLIESVAVGSTGVELGAGFSSSICLSGFRLGLLDTALLVSAGRVDVFGSMAA